MAVNRDKPDRWKEDIAQSVDMYNDWFVRFAPKAYRMTRVRRWQGHREPPRHGPLHRSSKHRLETS